MTNPYSSPLPVWHQVGLRSSPLPVWHQVGLRPSPLPVWHRVGLRPSLGAVALHPWIWVQGLQARSRRHFLQGLVPHCYAQDSPRQKHPKAGRVLLRRSRAQQRVGKGSRCEQEPWNSFLLKPYEVYACSLLAKLS
ncbi:hypothetical protein DQ04_07251010 [Trypanosoma grayi]|uniref:hypothetical protein n=1 Tax=Trypanosoma grayi TaxID=71804 RepID=UPI0004F4578C|nr:hypothetical protein DQ04_07251010 [Trypanosoma grayi]KEG08410.1 hypothetical protein DQ04_07251010 [Trypanosoma grayi]